MLANGFPDVNISDEMPGNLNPLSKRSSSHGPPDTGLQDAPVWNILPSLKKTTLHKGHNMPTRRILVIGGVAAGTKAAAKCRRELPAAEITVITDEPYISYAGCGLPYFLGGLVERASLEVKRVEDFKRENNIDVLTEHRALRIDPVQKRVAVKDLREGREKEFGYDTLILATGARPLGPPVRGTELKNIFTLRTIADAEAMKSLVDGGGVKNAVVIGGGYIGLEMAENLHARGVRVTVVEALPHILPRFDEEMALLVQRHIREKGVEVLTGSRVIKFEGNDSGEVKYAVTEGGEMIDADLVLWSTGVRPNTELARAAGAEIGPTHAIRVNDYMQTSLPAIYAAGDCAEMKHLITGKPVWIPLGSTANKMGRVAAINATGGKDSLPGVLGTSIVKIFDLNAGMTGLTQKEAEAEGFEVETVLVPADDRASYYPGHEIIFTKLVVSKKTNRILGGQVVGRGVVDKPIDVLVAAISLNGTMEELAKMDFAYAPPFSPAMNSLITAANVMLNKLEGRFNGVSASATREMTSENRSVQLVDVRTQEQYDEKHLANSRLIPWVELRRRLGELSKDLPAVVVCNRGKSAYSAQLILQHAGFKDVKTMEGGMTAYPFETESEKK